MSKPLTLRGMATVSFWSDDVKAAKRWYSELLGIEPYFERPSSEDPQYIEFRLGDYQHELGDPFRNVLGLMYNPHYLEMLDSK